MGIFDRLFKPNVERLREKKNVKGLIKALRHKDWHVREEAAWALGGIGDARAVEPLIQALMDDSDVLRRIAAWALGEIGDRRAVEPLIQALEDRDPDVQEKAAEALGKIGDARAVEPLIQALKDKDSDVREKAAEALGKIGDTRAVEHLFQALKDDKDWDVRGKAAEALGEIGEPAVEPLIQALKDEDSVVRRIAAEALGKTGDKRAVERLIQALKDKDEYWVVRERAAEVLDEMGWEPRDDTEKVYYLIVKQEWLPELGESAVEPLIQALKDKYSEVGIRAAEALGKIGDKRAVEAVIKYLFEFSYLFEYPSVLSQKYSSSLINLFGDYTDLILKACSYRCITIREDYDSPSYDYDLQEAITATKRLCDIRTPISSNILLLIAKRRDIEVTTGYSCGGAEKGTLSFESQRKIAKEELERRGNPPYEPSAYLKKEAWKL